ncbi:MAG: transposase [Candidatus Methanofastidiosa archaeon]|nr:transposase [Candidatus Methanofastidiosa archaeon]
MERQEAPEETRQEGTKIQKEPQPHHRKGYRLNRQRHHSGNRHRRPHGIRKRGNPAGKAHRDSLDRWAFHELRSFIEYKAKLAGVPVYAVDPHHTSQMCPLCGHTSKSNRKTQSDFACTNCGHTMNADLNAAINIQYRAAVNQPIALRPELSFREVGSASQPALAVGS